MNDDAPGLVAINSKLKIGDTVIIPKIPQFKTCCAVNKTPDLEEMIELHHELEKIYLYLQVALLKHSSLIEKYSSSNICQHSGIEFKDGKVTGVNP